MQNVFDYQIFVHVQMHPNPAHTCCQEYELAGKLVGKCLLECALDNVLPLKVNFTRSFLAQLIGLKVDYSVSWLQCQGKLQHPSTNLLSIQYYEDDDPLYYKNKIQYTLQEDVTEFDMFYTDTADDVRSVIDLSGCDFKMFLPTECCSREAWAKEESVTGEQRGLSEPVKHLSACEEAGQTDQTLHERQATQHLSAC